MFDLFDISKLIAGQALQMGGSDMGYSKAIFCPYIRDDGTPCFDEDTGSSYIDCPICSGEGALYEKPVNFRGIYTDNTNRYESNGSGGFMKGSKELSVPALIKPSILKARHSNHTARRLLRDKFLVYGRCCNPDGSREIKEVLYLLEDPVYPTVNSGYIYTKLKVGNNY